MSEGLLKPEKDFSKEADKLIPEAESLSKACAQSLCLYMIYHN